MSSVACRYYQLIIIAILAIYCKLIWSELTWTPVLPTQPNQVDLWTLSQSGCSCHDGGGGGDCACCVPRVACPCGDRNPHRCAQCGLQHHCNNMCNMTIDGALLSVSSGTLEGSLVPPSSPGPPIYCWYSLRAPPGHRVEVQIHRLVHIGNALNGTHCRGGYVEVSDQEKRELNEDRYNEQSLSYTWGSKGGVSNWERQGREWSSRTGRNVIRICGEDQRLHPPLVLFSDSGIATIIYKVRDRKGSPRFIAYYNFPPMTHPVTGDKQWGGTRIEYTECDWLYQDMHCLLENVCHLTSPGHPGLYPADIKCKYLFTMGSPAVRGTISFLTVDLPEEKCKTDYLALYAGTSTSSPLISKLCGRNKKNITFHGPSVLLLFSAGSISFPFQYGGFHASVNFVDKDENQRTAKMRHSTTTNAPDNSVLSDPSGVQVGRGKDCLRVFWSNASRSGHFDTSAYAQSHSYSQSAGSFTLNPLISSRKGAKIESERFCRLRFIGKVDEVVQISFFKYRLNGKSCSSEVSIYDGIADEGADNLIHHICGPITREPKDSKGRFLQPEFITSSSTVLEIHLSFGKKTDPERQFIAGAYQFHSSRLEGTKKPDSVCDVMFYGADSPKRGVVRQPKSALLWNIEGRLTCSYFFVPAANQTLELIVDSITGTRGSGHCTTFCGMEGCQCRPSNVSLDQVDHLLLIESKKDRVIGCLCGDVRNVTPVSFLATSAVDVRYHVGRYFWSSPGFNFSLSYTFPLPTLCGSTGFTTRAGLLVAPSTTSIPESTYIFGFCSWLIENQHDTQLTVVVQPPSNGSCLTWNLSVEARVRVGEDRPLGSVCAGGRKGSFNFAQHDSGALISLERGGRPNRDWLLTWHTMRSGVAITDSDEYTPKPELSRTLHGHPTGRTFTIGSNGLMRKSSLEVTLLLQIVIIVVSYELLLCRLDCINHYFPILGS